MLRPFRLDKKESLLFCTLALSHTTHIFNSVLTVPVQMLTSRKDCQFMVMYAPKSPQFVSKLLICSCSICALI